MDQAKLWQENLKHVWLQFTQMEEMRKGSPKIIASAKGNYVKDLTGKEYLDGLAGLFTVQVGHGRKELAQTMVEQYERLDFYSLFGFSNVPAIELARKLSDITPGDLSVTCFNCSGSEAVEVALKIARQYQRKATGMNRYKVVARRMSFHGVTMGALSANGLPHIRAPYEPLVPGFRHISPPNCYRCEFGKQYPDCEIDCAKALEAAIKFERPETVCAFIAEPVQAVGAIIVPPKEYFPIVEQICERYGVILIIDEVLNGFGRTGRMFASEHWGITPDLMTLGKGIGSGCVPLSATIAVPRLSDAFYGKFYDDTFHHGQTFSGHPVACKTALKNLEIIEKEKLVENAAKVGEYLRNKLESLLSHKIVGRVSGIGLLFCVELVKDRETREPLDEQIGIEIRERIYELGLVLRFQFTSLVLSPPLTLTKSEADIIVRIIDQAIGEKEKELSY